MNKSQAIERFKLLMPYFLLAVAIITFYRLSDSINVFLDFFRTAWNVILPFFYGFMLAYIINIPSSGIRRLLARSKNKFVQKWQRLLSVLLVFASIIAIIAIALSLIIPTIRESVAFFIENVPSYWESILYLIDYFNSLDLFGLEISAEGVFNLFVGFFEEFSLEALANPLNAIAGVGSAVFTGFIAFISSIYILVEKDKFKAFLVRLLKVFTRAQTADLVIDTFRRLNEYFKQYIRTQTIDGIILGTMATILLTLLGSPYALLLGIMLGIVNYIPYFGSIFGTGVAVAVVLLTQGFAMGGISAVSLIIVQQIDANIIQPRLMSDSFALSPLLIIISISIGGAIAGIFGMLIAIPIVAVLKDIFDSVLDHYERRQHKKK